MFKSKIVAIFTVLLLATLFTAGCDVEKQMDTMVDNPSFAEPLFTKFMARPEYQMKAIDTILADPALRQMFFDKMMENPEYAQAAVDQLMSNADARAMLDLLMAEPPATEAP